MQYIFVFTNSSAQAVLLHNSWIIEWSLRQMAWAYEYYAACFTIFADRQHNRPKNTMTQIPHDHNVRDMCFQPKRRKPWPFRN